MMIHLFRPLISVQPCQDHPPLTIKAVFQLSICIGMGHIRGMLERSQSVSVSDNGQFQGCVITVVCGSTFSR